MNTLKQYIYCAAATLLMFACSSKPEPAEQESNLIEITNQQFATDAMQLGKIEDKTFENIVECNGTIVSQPNGKAKVNAPINGIVKSISCLNGQSVDKNQLLIEITGNEIIDIQKEFAEVSANHKRIKSEFERIKSLYNEKVTSEKEFILAETEFKISMAKYNGLRLKIEAIGLSLSKIENGDFYSSYSIKSPISGFTSNLNANIGSYVDSQTELLEIINPAMFQVKLSVFATDIRNLRKGQTVRFKSTNSNDIHLAAISTVGVAVDSETKSIECYASITEKRQTNLIVNEYVKSEIITSIDKIKAIPTEALIKTESGYVLLVLSKQEKEKYLFSKTEVKVGRQANGYSEILDSQIDGQIITKGAYNITL